jgi:predicted DNA-binding protein with PD1-like motif
MERTAVYREGKRYLSRCRPGDRRAPVVQAVHEGTRWVLRLDEGQDLFEVLTSFAEREHVTAGAILFGIGMFRSATFGYWDGTQYRPHALAAPAEVVALHGTIAEADGHPSIHLHGAVAGPDHHLVGGHLLKATVGILQELVLETFPGRAFGRPMVESVGLRMLDLEPGPRP